VSKERSPPTRENGTVAGASNTSGMKGDGRNLGFDVRAAERFINSVRWTFARTMPDWPHEYTVRAWRPDLDDEFDAMCDLIRTTGFVEPWPPPPSPAIYYNHYLVIGAYKYWAMGRDGDRGALANLTVINRAARGLTTSRSVTGLETELSDSLVPGMDERC
jgi:hypothetical protein